MTEVHIVHVFDPKTGKQTRVLAGHNKAVTSIAVSLNGGLVASGDSTGVIRIWDSTSGRALRQLEHKGKVRELTFSSDGKILASMVYNERQVRLWDTSGGKLIRIIEDRRGEYGLSQIALSPDGNTLATLRLDSKKVQLWDVLTGQRSRSLARDDKYAGDDNCHDMAFSPDGRTLASVYQEGTIRLWDPVTGSRIKVLRGGGDSVAFSPDGKVLASSGNPVLFWDVRSGRRLAKLSGKMGPITRNAFGQNGKTLASTSMDGTLRLWDVTGRKLRATLIPFPRGWIAFTPDRRYKVGGDVEGGIWFSQGRRRIEATANKIPGWTRMKEDQPLSK